MNKKVYKLEITDILMNLFLSLNSFPYIKEWLAVKYFRRGNYQNFPKTLATDSSDNVKGVKVNSGLKSDIFDARSKNKQFHEVIKQLSDEPPGHCSLYQNSPDPFSKKTIINFQCSCHSFISLKIYDITWKEISTLVFEKKEPGTYQIEFDGNSLNEGVYFYRLTAGEFTDVKRMMLVK